MESIVLCSRATDNELIAAECESLTGGKPSPDGLAFCQTAESVTRAAYLSTGLQLIARAETLSALAEEVRRVSFKANRFRIDSVCLLLQKYPDSQKAILCIADAIQGSPDLDHPLRHFLLIIRKGEFLLGEIQAVATRSYHKHDAKPYRTSSSLPSQLARALVNLTYPAKIIHDPCCGTGSILLEACALGLTASGMDNNPKMVGMARRNLRHFGYQALVQRGDARQSTFTAEAVVTDLPYGRFLEHDEANIRGIVSQMIDLAPLGIYLTEQDIAPWLQEAGYREVEVYRLRKRFGMTRFIHRARV